MLRCVVRNRRTRLQGDGEMDRSILARLRVAGPKPGGMPTSTILIVDPIPSAHKMSSIIASRYEFTNLFGENILFFGQE
jgi:hypothetical protein